MASHEIPSGKGEPSKFIDLFLVSEITEAYCDWFREKYGRGEFRAMLETNYILAEDYPPGTNNRGPKNVRFTPLVPHIDSEGVLLDGRVTGMRLVPEDLDDSGIFIYNPYIELKDVSTISPSYQLSRNEFDCFWVPLDGAGENLLLYDPNEAQIQDA